MMWSDGGSGTPRAPAEAGGADSETTGKLVDSSVWARQDSNLRLTDYESAALTN